MNECWRLSFFLSCQAHRTVLREVSFRVTAPPSPTSKSPSPTCLLLIRDNASLSAITGLNSSIKSSARLGLPGLSRCRKPTAGSSPTDSRALLQSCVNRVYRKDSKAFTRSRGGRFVLPLKRMAGVLTLIKLSNTPKYSCAASPSIPRRTSTCDTEGIWSAILLSRSTTCFKPAATGGS